MKLVDANVLLYAVDETAPHHEDAKRWLDDALSGTETVLLPWLSPLAFVRLATHPSLQAQPLSADQAFDVVDLWLAGPAAEIPKPAHGSGQTVRDLLAATGRGGNLVNDAFLAALAIQYRAEVVTYDNDFDRFPGVKWTLPGPA
jgi:toxin-antitoxin system PIN domain toxin